MADRLPQYPMLPSNFNPNLLQQQQISQSQVDSQSIAGFTNSENGRVWQTQYHSQQGGNPSGSQQMTEMLRNQSMARVQGQQQLGQQFGLGPQMGAQQPSFHDQATQQPQPHIQSNFPSMAMANASQLQQLNSRNAMLQAFQANNQGHMRQLEMMGLTQNQQVQNGSASYSARLAQQQQHQANMNNSSGQNQPSQSDLFSSPSVSSVEAMRRSPSHPPSQPPGPIGNQQGSMLQNGQGRRHTTFPELRERAQQLQDYIIHHEQLALQMSNQRGSVPDSEFLPKMHGLTNEIKNRKESLSKVIQAMGNSASLFSGQSLGNVGNMRSMNGSPLQPHQQPNSIQNGQNPSSWMSQQPSQPQGLGNPQMGGQVPSHGQTQSHNIQPNPLQLQSQANQSQQQQQSLVPPRAGPTPHQLLAGQMSPNMASQFPFMTGGQGGAQPRPEQILQNAWMPMPPPLEKARFESTYANFCNSKGITQESRLSVDNRLIDLHSLHSYVMNEGGGAKVNQKELWSVIGGRMGFIQVPATETEPAKSSPGVAQRLAHIYKECLVMFDNVYIHSVMEQKRKLQATAVHHTQGSLNLAAGQNAPRIPVSNAQQMQMLVAYANISAADLRARGIPERLVQFVEQNRAYLQHTAQQHQAFRGMLLKTNQPGPLGQPSEPDRMPPSNGAGQFLSQQNPSIASTLPNSGARPQHFIPPNHGMLPMVNGSSLTNSNMDTQFPRQPGPQGTQNGAAPPNRPPRPTQEQMHHAITFIGKAKQDFLTRNIPTMPFQVVPDDQRDSFIRTVEQLYRFIQDLEPRLPMYFIMAKQEEMIRKLVTIIVTVQQQKVLLTGPTPKYIIDLSMLHMMVSKIAHANEIFSNILQNFAVKQQPPNSGSLANGHPGATRPPSQPPPPSQQPIPPPPLPNRSLTLSQPPPPKKKAPPIQPGPSHPVSSATISTPATPPAPSASTPAANAPTPTQSTSSPQGAKSPKSKPASKPKTVGPTKRKVSKNIPAAPEVVAPPTPSAGPGSKRVREEETTATDLGPSNEPSSPKRVKTEWEGPPSEALTKKQEDIDNIKTEEDASAFFERMTELIKLGCQGEESLTSNIAANLDMILKGCGAVPDAPGGASMSLGLGESLGLRESSPKPAADEFVEFFDFSSFGTLDDDDPGSKAPTPDLVSSSSTNPSPESGSEADPIGHVGAVDLKTEDLDLSDPLRLGQWKEIDGGESAYYQQDPWKWDGPMPTLEPPWAIYTS